MSYLTFLYQDKLYNNIFVEFPGIYTIGGGKKDNLFIAGMKEKNIVIKSNKMGICSIQSSEPSFFSENIIRNNIILLDKENKLVLYVNEYAFRSDKTLKLPLQGVIKFGRGNANNVQIKCPFLSKEHFILRADNGVFYLEDCASTNGIFLNGKRVVKARLHSGDLISILNINIRLLNGVLYFENIDKELMLNELCEDYGLGGTALKEKGKDGGILYRRSPRTQEKLPSEDIVLAAAPTAPQKYEKRKGAFNSMIGTGAMFAANMAMGTMSPALMAARAASLVSPITSVVTQVGSEKERKKKGEDYASKRIEKYGNYIEEQKARIDAVAQKQRSILINENPTAIECSENLKNMKRTLWERTIYDRDFLDVRLGMGYEKLCVQVKSRENNGFVLETDEMRELAEQIIEETRIVDNIPYRISLAKYQTISVIGERKRVNRLMKNMLTSLAFSHCFNEVKIVGIFDKEEYEEWKELRWMPHVWDEEKKMRYLAFSQEDAHQLCETLLSVVKQRTNEKEERQNERKVSVPYYIFVLGSRLYTEKEEIMSFLTSNEPPAGITTLFLFDDLYSLPHNCKFIVDVDHGPCAYVKDEINHKIFFTEDEPITDSQFKSYSRMMSAIELEGILEMQKMPDSISFLKGYGVKRVEELNVLERWKSNLAYRSLGAPIGVMSGNKHFSLDIHEKAHGPHGLVAGTTGSGKSEMLQIWILSMCTNYHPYEVAFVIIDYKGGGMADLLMDLPHVVGKITNIGTNIGRTLISLNAEIKRRMHIFAEYGVNHIDKYQELFRTERARHPLPHLIIVVDEFAELKKEQPDFMANLVSAAAVGRSLGIHLVLATQKPSGVVNEQIQSNSRFRICLKVQSVGDSREMIKRPDAASIVQAGRGYIRVGEDEVYEMFQSYWSGAPYYEEPLCEEVDHCCKVALVLPNGSRINPTRTENVPKSEIDELVAIRTFLKTIAETNGIKKLAGPWLPELPVSVFTCDLLPEAGFCDDKWLSELPWLKVPVGIYDAPAIQQQGIQYIDLAENGHLGIYGAPGSGKTTLLKSIVWGLGYYYRPNDVNIYIIDFGGWSMNIFSNLPHVGGIALDCEEEKISKLSRMISEEIVKRKKEFMKYGVSSLNVYRQTVHKNMPAYVIAVDNIVALFEQMPDIENLMITLAREGATYGIYLIYTSNNTTGVRYKVLQNINNSIAFELTDKGDYPNIVGRLDGIELSKVKGRAFIKGTPPVEFQAAIPVNGESEIEQALIIKNICIKMNEAWTGNRPERIPVMPEILSFDELFINSNDFFDVPLGISYSSIKTVKMDLSEKYVLLISGMMNSGKSRWLYNTTLKIHEREEECKLYVFDSNGGVLSKLSNIATAYSKVNQDESVTSIIEEIIAMLNQRKKEQNQQRTGSESTFSEKDFISNYNKIVVVIDDLKEFVDAVSQDNKNSMERICRLAKGLGIIVLASGRVADVERYNEIESLTRAIVSYQKGIVIGGVPRLYSFFQCDLGYKEKEMEIGKENGMVFDCGHCEKIMLAK